MASFTFFITGITMGFVAASCSAVALYQEIIARYATAKAKHYRSDNESIFASFLRNGVGIFKPLSNVLLKNSRVKKSIDELIIVLDARAVVASSVSVCSLLCFASALLFLITLVLCQSLLVGILSAFVLIIIVVAYSTYYVGLRREMLREAVPDVLRSMSVCFQAGLSLGQTFEQVSHEVDENLKPLFTRVVHDLATGRTVNEALLRFRRSVDVRELAFVTVAFDVQHNAGGSMRRVLDAARDSVESEIELRRSLRVQTAQAKLSAKIVTAMPFVLLLLFSVLSPGFLNPFFTSIEGLTLLGLACIMQIAGILLVRRLLDTGTD